MNVSFVCTRFMGHTFWQCWHFGPRKCRCLFEVKGSKRLALRVAKHRGYHWQPMAGVIL